MTDKRIMHLACKGLNAGYKPGEYVSKNISFEVNEGEVMAIMGPSGSGKSTILNALLGRLRHVSGKILLNQDDITREGLACVRDQVGLVPQDDVLVNELTVRENLRAFHAVAVDSGLTTGQVEKRIDQCLADLELGKVADSRVGSPDGSKFNISGGQRKRANIAMELVNQPKILIIDEPTSGLSSRDSLSLVRTLRKLAKDPERRMMVIMIIHQPSSDIFKLIDRLLLLDRKGHGVASGPREEVLRLAGSLQGSALPSACGACGSEFPDRLMEVVESSLDGWPRQSAEFSHRFGQAATGDVHPYRRNALVRNPWHWGVDVMTLVRRQLTVKFRDRMSLLITFVAPVILGLLIGVVFKSTPQGAEYAFETNGLFPQMLFLLVICGLFLGLVSSVFEVIKDRPMLRREQLRGLSTGTYYLSELLSLALTGAAQAILMSGVGLMASGALFLFGTVCFAIYLAVLVGVVAGLLVSILFSSPIAAYNMIPALLVPQIILGGALLPYQDMGEEIHLWDKDSTLEQPFLAKAAPASWVYEYTLRAAHAATEAADRPHNQAIRAIQDLPGGAFLSLTPRRMPTKTGETLLGGGGSGAPRPEDVNLLGLLVFLGLGVGSGLLWIRREFALSTPTPYFAGAQVLLLVVGIGAYYGLTEPRGEPETVAEDTEVVPAASGTIASDRSFSYGGAERYCAQQGMRMADVDELLQAFNRMDPILPPQLFWTAGEVGDGRIHAVDFSKLDLSVRGPLSRETLGAQPKVLFQTRKNAFWAHVACLP